jgi:hypothetical protein
MTRPPRLPNTEAYLRLREQAQGVFEFAVLTGHAVPALRHDISEIQSGARTGLESPDYFDWGTTTLDQLNESQHVYQERMANYLLLSSFSFFEAYIKDAVLEFLRFHGGSDRLIQLAARRDAQFIASQPKEKPGKVQKLRKPASTDGITKFTLRKLTEELRAQGYRFPSDLLSAFGIRMLVRQLSNFKASHIPMLLTEGLHMPLSAEVLKEFDRVRVTRNAVAHGRPAPLTIKAVADMNSTLRDIAKTVEDHLIRHFFVQEFI